MYLDLILVTRMLQFNILALYAHTLSKSISGSRRRAKVNCYTISINETARIIFSRTSVCLSRRDCLICIRTHTHTHR